MTFPPRPGAARSAGLVATVAILVVAALVGPSLASFELVRLESVVPFAIAVLSMNLLTGFSGQISLGQSAFFGTGAYVAAVLINDQHWSYLAGGAAGVVGAAVLGLLVGVPAIRLRGLYVAIATLGLGVCFPDVIQRLQTLTGGSQGLSMQVFANPPGWTGLTSTEWTLDLSLLLLAVAMLVVWNIRRSPTGRALIAVRDHESVAQSFGIPLARAKLFAFVLSAALAGLAGVVYLIQQQFIAPTSFGLQQSIEFFVGMAIGGQMSVVGAVVGGMFLVYAPVESTNLGVSPLLTPVVYGIFLLFFMYFVRAGVAGACVSLWRRVRSLWSGRSDPPSHSSSRPRNEDIGGPAPGDSRLIATSAGPAVSSATPRSAAERD